MSTHAYLVIADDLAQADIAEDLKRETTDVRHIITTNFGINEARQLKELASERGWGEGSHRFVITTHSLTREAQNALLKLFEDPPTDTIFYLVVPHESILLPTLRSRLLLHGARRESKRDLAEKFLNSDYKDRLTTIADLAKNDTDSLKDLARSLGRSMKPTWPKEAKEALLFTDRYVYNRGASKKMLLENLALSIPIEKK